MIGERQKIIPGVELTLKKSRKSQKDGCAGNLTPPADFLHAPRNPAFLFDRCEKGEEAKEDT